MTDALAPTATHHATHRSHRLLCEIADVLGVDIDTLQAVSPSRPFFSAEDGTQWFLVTALERGPVVREVAADAGHPVIQDETIAAFFAREGTTPQGQALAAIIDRLVTANFR